MALPLCLMPLLRITLAKITAAGCRVPAILSLGYPDMMAPAVQLAAFFKQPILERLRYRSDSEAVVRWHGLPNMPIVDTTSFFEALGTRIDYIDIRASRGVERLVDLNDVLPADMIGKYDLVLDCGTLEHCFNVAQAITNVALAVSEGGFIIHATPLNVINHGFFNLNPTFFADFYGQNGGEIIFLKGVTAGWPQQDFFDLPLTASFTHGPEKTGLVIVVRRTQASPIKWPTQSKYRLSAATE